MTAGIPTLFATAAAPAESFAKAHFPPETVALFLAIFLGSVLIDLRQHKGAQEISVRREALWSAFWVCLSLGFAGWLKVHHGADHPDWASLFITGYVLEKTLSVDNLMVFIAVFRYFRISSGLQHRVLYYGILGAIGFRAVFVGVGSGLLRLAGPWAELVFGAFVLWAAVQMSLKGDDDGDGEPDYEAMGLVRFFKRFFPVFPRIVGDRFFLSKAEAEAAAREHGVELKKSAAWWMTPAFVCVLVIEGSDVMFSVDSVPAVIAVTREPIIVYTSMIFAVLGLRSLYFIVESLTQYLSRLEAAVIAVLGFIGVKMFAGAAAHFGYRLPWWGELDERVQANYSLAVVLGLLALGVAASYAWPAAKAEPKTAAREVAGGE